MIQSINQSITTLPTDHEEYRRQRNMYFQTIRHAKDAQWKQYLWQAEGPDIWAAFRYTNPRKAQLTPELRAMIDGKEHISSNFEQKVRAFQVLFPSPPLAPPTMTTRCRTEIPWHTFSPTEIKMAIFTSSPKKSRGPDALTFACLRQAYTAIPHHFNTFYATLGTVGYDPESWRQATTIVITSTETIDFSIGFGFAALIYVSL
jgi:hypothetical protein